MLREFQMQTTSSTKSSNMKIHIKPELVEISAFDPGDEVIYNKKVYFVGKRDNSDTYYLIDKQTFKVFTVASSFEVQATKEPELQLKFSALQFGDYFKLSEETDKNIFVRSNNKYAANAFCITTGSWIAIPENTKILQVKIDEIHATEI